MKRCLNTTTAATAKTIRSSLGIAGPRVALTGAGLAATRSLSSLLNGLVSQPECSLTTGRGFPSPSSTHTTHSRSYTTAPSSKPDEPAKGKDLWEEIFKKVDIKANAQNVYVRRESSLPPKSSLIRPSRSNPFLSSTSAPQTSGRQSLTLEESTIFADIFSKIFESQSASNIHKRSPSTRESLSKLGIASSSSSVINQGARQLDSLFGKLRKRSKRLYNPSETQLFIEQQRLEMESFGSDRELLEWAQTNIFNTEDPEGFPTKIPSALSISPSQSKKKSSTPSLSPSTELQVEREEGEGTELADPTQTFLLASASYPHLLQTLIHLLRDKFHDPHAALALFSYARTLSVPSYVFGCTTGVYNELLATWWFSLCTQSSSSSFSEGASEDAVGEGVKERIVSALEGLLAILEEMDVNGVKLDAESVKLLAVIRKEAVDEGLVSSPSSFSPFSSSSLKEEPGSDSLEAATAEGLASSWKTLIQQHHNKREQEQKQQGDTSVQSRLRLRSLVAQIDVLIERENRAAAAKARFQYQRSRPRSGLESNSRPRPSTSRSGLSLSSSNLDVQEGEERQIEKPRTGAGRKDGNSRSHRYTYEDDRRGYEVYTKDPSARHREADRSGNRRTSDKRVEGGGWKGQSTGSKSRKQEERVEVPDALELV